MRHSIRTRLIIISISLAVVPLLIVGILVGTQTFNVQSQQAVALQHQVANREAEQVANFFNQLEDQLQHVAQDNRLLTSEPTQQQITLSGLLSHQHAFDKVYLLDSTGQEKVGVSRTFAIADSDLVSRADADEFKIPSATDEVFYGTVHTDQRTGEPIVTVAIPIEDIKAGTVAAVLVADVRFLGVQDIILAEQANNPQTGTTSTYMIDSAGRVLAHSDPSISLRGLNFLPPSQDRIQNGLSGEQVVLASDTFHLGNQTYTVVTESLAQQALALAFNTILFTVVLIVLAAVASILVGFAIVNQIVRPILSLAATAQSIEGGDLSKQADVSSQDEIGQMAVAFNGMTAQLRQTLKGLQDHVEDLEKARVERENLIKDLQAARRLAEENSRLKSEFLSTMSHELRTPLNAIEGFTGVILNKIGGSEYNSKTEGYLNRIRANSRRLLSLINDFLDLSRVEAGRLELANQPFSPEQLVKRWHSEISVLAEKKGLQFEINLDSGVPSTLYGDEEAISKIALNLLGNAIKFTEQGEIKLELGSSEGSWSIAVEDTGIGIPPHAREFIFEEFRQVDQTTKRKYGGTGLGLAIVQKYTRAMGGTVNVKSEQGKGSIFTVSLPLKTTA